MTRTTLTIILLAIYVIAIIGIGVWNSKNDSSQSYFLASRKLPAWLLAITFIASWWGGGSAIDLVNHAHKNGLSSFWVYGVPVLIATALMYLFSKGIRNIGTISQPELMNQRYNNTVALLLTLFIIIFMVIASAVQVIVIGRFFDAYFDLGYANGAILGTVIVLAYSMFGGFKGVVLTDLLQFVFFLLTGIFLFYLTYSESGGMEAVTLKAVANGKIGYTSFFTAVADNLAYVITFGTSWMIQANIWQRISAAKKASDAKKMMLISFIVFIPLYLMVTYTGMFSSVLYETVPATGIIPDMVSKLDSPILSAILFVGLCSAIMSTMDSLINTGALSLTVDVFQKYIRPNAAPKTGVMIARISTLVMAFVALFIALEIQSVLTISWIASDFLTSGAFVPLVMCFLWARGTSKAATVSMLFGLVFATYNLMVALGLDLPVAWEIASAKQAIIGISISFILYVGISLATKADTEKSLVFIRKANVFGRY